MSHAHFLIGWRSRHLRTASYGSGILGGALLLRQLALGSRMAVFEFIEGFYNPRRRHSALGNVSPIVYERRYSSKASARLSTLLYGRGVPPHEPLWYCS